MFIKRILALGTIFVTVITLLTWSQVTLVTAAADPNHLIMIEPASPDLQFPRPPFTPTNYLSTHQFFRQSYLNFNSTLYLQNPTNTTANYVITAYNTDGSILDIYSGSLLAKTLEILEPADLGLPPSSDLLIDISADQPLQSVVNTTDGTHFFSEHGGTVNNTPYPHYFGPFTNQAPAISSIHFTNVGNATTDVDMVILDQSGQTVLTETRTVPSGGRADVATVTLPGLPPNITGTVQITADQPLVGISIQYYPNEQAANQPGLGHGANEHYIPRVFKHVNEGSGLRTTTLFAAAVDTSPINLSVTFANEDATVAGTYNTLLNPGASTLIDLSTLPFLPDSGTWAAFATSDGQFVLNEVTLHEETPQGQASDYASYALTGSGFYTNALPYLARSQEAFTRFSVSSYGVSPANVTITYYDATGTIIYTDTAMMAPGTWQRYAQDQMGVLGHNFEGHAIITSDQPIITWVDEYLGANPLPDLSNSTKTATADFVTVGDTLTYTLVLQNASPITATAVLSDPLSTYTRYLTGTAQASSGLITATTNLVQWSGEITMNSPITLTFATEVLSASVGTAITNTAYLQDHLGHLTPLTAVSHVTHYALTINEDTPYTNIPTVTLDLFWGVNSELQTVHVSNQATFSSTTSYPLTPTINGWVIETDADFHIPRTVYALFRDAAGTEFGPVTDTIRYDPIPPQINQMLISPTITGTTPYDVIIHVAASDDHSGLQALQLSHQADFTTLTTFTLTTDVIQVPWTLQTSGVIYGRVRDQAGNTSAVVMQLIELESHLYLPFVINQP